MTFRILAAALVACGLLAPAADAAEAPTHGQIDADVVSAGGKTLGILHGHINANGKGLLTYRPDPGADAVLGITANGSAITAKAKNTELKLRLGAKHRLTGEGSIKGKRVTVHGAGGETAPDLKDGMKLLVLGHPKGEGYAALREQFKLVPFDTAKHGRAKLLTDRITFHKFAGIVLGPDVKPATIRHNRLIVGFYGAGKWVIEAGATAKTAKALGVFHPFLVSKPAPAIAVRSTGPEGDLQRIRPTVIYPDAPKGQKHLSIADRDAARLRRETWFRNELRRYAPAHMASAKGGSSELAHAAADDSDFVPPYGATAMEMPVSTNLDYVLNTSGLGHDDYDNMCGWNTTTHNAWCPDTSFYQQHQGGDTYGTDRGQLASNACQWFLANNYWMIDKNYVQSRASTTNSQGAYSVPDVDSEHQGPVFIRRPGDTCPAARTQTVNFQTVDFYYAIYDPASQQDTLIVETDPTITADVGGKLAFGSADTKQSDVNASVVNGTGSLYQYGWSLYGGNTFEPVTQHERGFTLARYDNQIGLDGTHLDASKVAYRGSLSVPRSTITFQEDSGGETDTQSFSYGVFGTDGTITHATETSKSKTVTINVPDWSVTPSNGPLSVNYDWQTNTPTSWSTITNNGASTWGINALQLSGFNPDSLSVWQTPATYGDVNITLLESMYLTSQYEAYNGTNGLANHYASQLLYQYLDESDYDTAIGKTTTGLNLCDPSVMPPPMAANCKG